MGPSGGGLLLVGSLAEGPHAPCALLLDVRTRGVRRELELPDGATRVLSVALSPCGEAAAAGLDDGFVVWDAGSGAQRLRVCGGQSGADAGHRGEVTGVGFSPCGTRLVTAGGDDRRVVIWDLASGAPAAPLLGHAARVRTAVFSPDGAHVASGGDDMAVRVWDAASGALERTLEDVDSETAHAVAFAADDGRVATAGTDDVCKVWDAENVYSSVEGHDASVLALAFSPDGAALAVPRPPRHRRPHRARVRPPPLQLRRGVRRGALTRGAQTAGADAAVRLWNRAGEPVLWLATHAQGPHMLGCRCREADGAPHPECPPVPGHAGAVRALAYSGEAHIFATGGDDGAARVWDGARGELLVALDAGFPIGALAFVRGS